MDRRTVLGLAPVALLAGCGVFGGRAAPPAATGAPTLVRLTAEDEAAIPGRVLASLNSLRAAAGAGPVALDPLLASAAATHSRDMSVQNRPWHFGSDGSSPLDRLARVGYRGALIGEVISETFETELVTLAAWAEEPGTREVVLNPAATRMGIGWFQEPGGKLWWTMVMAR